MKDNTLIGVVGVIAIVIVVALFLVSTRGMPESSETNIAGQAYTPHSLGAPAEDTCEPSRFCDGSKLVIVREDCSVMNAFCQYGCNKESLVCN